MSGPPNQVLVLASTDRMLARNAVHLARVLQSSGYPPS